MAAISETLRQARLRSGIDLDKLAAKTKINPRYLRAIESGDFDQLPSGIFARMFIKQYADAVGLDGASLAEEFQRTSQFGSPPPPLDAIADTRTNFHPNVRGFTTLQGRGDWLTSALSSLIWTVAAILVCAGAYYLVAHFREFGADRQNTAAAAHAPVHAPAPKPAVKPVETAPVPVPAATATPAASAEPPAATTPIRVTLTATAVVWVTARADGKTVISESLQPGMSKTVEAQKGARITLGDAGGMDITFNGKKLEPFGPKGQVRTVDFTSWGAQVVSRTPPNPDPLL